MSCQTCRAGGSLVRQLLLLLIPRGVRQHWIYFPGGLIHFYIRSLPFYHIYVDSIILYYCMNKISFRKHLEPNSKFKPWHICLFGSGHKKQSNICSWLLRPQPERKGIRKGHTLHGCSMTANTVSESIHTWRKGASGLSLQMFYRIARES